jgi:hypothetical protein
VSQSRRDPGTDRGGSAIDTSRQCGNATKCARHQLRKYRSRGGAARKPSLRASCKSSSPPRPGLSPRQPLVHTGHSTAPGRQTAPLVVSRMTARNLRACPGVRTIPRQGPLDCRRIDQTRDPCRPHRLCQESPDRAVMGCYRIPGYNRTSQKENMAPPLLFDLKGNVWLLQATRGRRALRS